MDRFLSRFREKIKGVITGADRYVFKGCLKSLMYADGVMAFLRYKGVLNKEYKGWARKQSIGLVEEVERKAIEECGRQILRMGGDDERKKKMVVAQQKELGIKRGLIGVWSAVEACTTYKARYDREAGFPQLRREYSKCKHLYLYYAHEQYGFMSVRIQTWLPYGIQIAMNGREWLARMLDREKIKYVLSGNKFMHIADYKRAQELMDKQMDVNWQDVLNSFLPTAFPTMKDTIGDQMQYYWTLWQSELATDYIFDDPVFVRDLSERIQRHALVTGKCDRILGYMSRAVNAEGQPHPNSKPQVSTRAGKWHDGFRVKHWVDDNSVKGYNEGNVYRAEATFNDPSRFRIFRHAQGQKKTGPKRRMPLRKSVADIPVRTEVAKEITRRFMNQMATLHDDTPVQDILKDVTASCIKNGRTVRALDITGKDRELLQAIADPKYAVCGITNKALRLQLKHLPWAKGGTDMQLSARITRHLRLLRDHGLIRKMPNQAKYQLTDDGRLLTTTLTAVLTSSVQHLMEKLA